MMTLLLSLSLLLLHTWTCGHKTWGDYCVVPENIHTPLPTEGIGNSGEWGVKRPRNFRSRGRGFAVMIFFFSRPVSIFMQLYLKFRCLYFASQVANAKKKTG